MRVAARRCSVLMVLCAPVFASWAEPTSSCAAIGPVRTDWPAVVNVRVAVRAPGSLAEMAAQHRDALAPAPDAYLRALLRRSSEAQVFELASRQARKRRRAARALALSASRRAHAIARI